MGLEGEKKGSREGWWNESTKEWPRSEQLETLAVEKAVVVNRREQRTRGRESGARRGGDAKKIDVERCKEMQISLFALGGSGRTRWNRTGPSCYEATKRRSDEARQTGLTGGQVRASN